MAEANPTVDDFKGLEQEKAKEKRSSTALRILKYTISRLVMMLITVTIGVYLTVLIANMGGYVDTIRKSQIREQVGMMVANDPVLRKLSPEARNLRIEEMTRDLEHRYGLDKPFIIRSFLYLKQALTLDLGRAMSMTSNSGSSSVRNIIIERLPPTLLLFGTADLILFFLALIIALSLSRHYGSVIDKIMIALTPLSSAPGWFYGIFLILIFADCQYAGILAASFSKYRRHIVVAIFEQPHMHQLVAQGQNEVLAWHSLEDKDLKIFV